MSILNVVMAPDRAYVAVDTAVVNRAGGRRGHSSKLVPLIELNAVVAVRGHQILLAEIACGCLQMPGDFDALASVFPDLLTGWYYGLFAPAEGASGPSDFEQEQVVLAGWSPSRS